MKFSKQDYDAIVAVLLARINPEYEGNAKLYSTQELREALQAVDTIGAD